VFVLEHEDIVNMICGLGCGIEEMSLIDKQAGGRLYSYHGGLAERFEWNRGEVGKLKDEKLIELYTAIKNNRKEKKTQAIAEVQSEEKIKRCYYRCSNCGSTDIGEEDKFCPSCGEQLKRQFKEEWEDPDKDKPWAYEQMEHAR
jgi:hypothetical protein